MSRDRGRVRRASLAAILAAAGLTTIALDARVVTGQAVDFGLIDKLGQQSRDARPGGVKPPTAGSLGDPSGGIIVIDPGYRTPPAPPADSSGQAPPMGAMPLPLDAGAPGGGSANPAGGAFPPGGVMGGQGPMGGQPGPGPLPPQPGGGQALQPSQPGGGQMPQPGQPGSGTNPRRPPRQPGGGQAPQPGQPSGGTGGMK